MSLANINNNRDLSNEKMIIYKESKVNKRRKRNKDTTKFIVDYSEYLLQQNYSPSTIGAHLVRTKQFCQQCIELYNKEFQTIDDFGFLTSENIIKYENFLIKRISQKEIKNESAYSCIKNIRLFLQFLHYKRIINFKYNIPKKFIVNPTRSF